MEKTPQKDFVKTSNVLPPFNAAGVDVKFSFNIFFPFHHILTALLWSVDADLEQELHRSATRRLP